MWMSNTRVFVHLTEEILAVNELKRTAPQCLELEVVTVDLAVLALGDDADYVGVAKSSGICEALANPVAGAGACDYEVNFAEV